MERETTLNVCEKCHKAFSTLSDETMGMCLECTLEDVHESECCQSELVEIGTKENGFKFCLQCGKDVE